MKTKITQSDLAQFTGTEKWYRHPLAPSITYTDGVRFLAENAGAYWLLDEIALAQWQPKVKAELFQFWKLAVAGSRAVLTCADGGKNGEESKVIFTKQIPFTDFPMSEVKLYFTDNVIMLPSEY